MSITRRMHKAVLCILLCALSACGTVNVQQRYAGFSQEQALKARYFDVRIPVSDGTRIKATVYQPALAAGQTAPLIIQTHGFGAFRTPRPLSFYGKLVLSGQAAIKAWRAGYWVISYDQRGFGGSGSSIQLMHPDYEVRDFSDIITWANDHLPALSRDNPRDPRVGAIGESYGGAVQLLASARDARLDSIVPIATWHDLANVIAPQHHAKTTWGVGLYLGGVFGSGFDAGILAQRRYVSLVKGTLPVSLQADLMLRSPARDCAEARPIQAKVLFLQGLRDSLMSFNEAYRNWRCAQQAGQPAYLIGLRDGHVLPWPLQQHSGLPLFNTQPRVHCGEPAQTTHDMLLAWWRHSLDGEPLPRAWPSLCLHYSRNDGEAFTQLPLGGSTYAIRPHQVKLVHSGLLELLLLPLDRLVDWVPNWLPTVAAENQPVTGGGLRPAFIPLRSFTEAARLAGIPRLNATLTTSTADQGGVLFAALGVRRTGKRYIRVLGEQYTPLPGDGHYQVDMPAVATRLNEGDTLGLVLQGFSGQYFLNPEGWLGFGQLDGEIELPLLEGRGLVEGKGLEAEELEK